MRESASSWRRLTIFLLALVLAFVSIASADGPNPIRIMPLGDSITYGSSSTGTTGVGYRRPLYQSLVGAGYSVDFVGSQTDPLDSPQDFDRNHEGHRGWRADAIRANITGWLNSTPADVVLLHIGTNDITLNQGATSTASEIGQILDLIDDWEEANNEVWVILACIINRNDLWAGTTTTLNGLIQTLANARIAAGDKVVVVNMESALSYPGDLSDTVHPNDTGYGKMAAVWFAALRTLPILSPNPDHDGDGDADGSDLAVFIAAFGSAVGDSNYDPRCDLDSSDNINEYDLALFAAAFGH